MVVVKPYEHFLGVEAWRKVGKPGQYGRQVYGYRLYGELFRYFGVYNRRTRYGHRSISLMKYYWPTNPNSPGQASNRAKFRAAVHAWQALTAEQKKVYNDIAIKRVRYGYWDFLRQFLKSTLTILVGYGLQVYGNFTYGDIPTEKAYGRRLYGQEIYGSNWA